MVSTFGIGAGISRMPKPGRHGLGQLACDVHQTRDHALANRRRLHARQLEAERVDDVLLLDVGLAVPEQRRLRVVIGEPLGLAAHLVIARRRAASGNDTKPAAPAWNGQPPPSELGS